MKPTKYSLSTLLKFSSVDRFLYRFADRNEITGVEPELVDRLGKCMIYFICCRPIVSIVPETFKQTGNEFEFEITYRVGNSEKKCKIKCPEELIDNPDGEIKISEYPHKSILILDKSGNLVEEILISNFVHLFKGVPDEISSLEILYIGKGTADCAIDRLNGHSTLEKILADILNKEPHKEVAILLYNFNMVKTGMSNSHLAVHAEITGKAAGDHLMQIHKYKPDIDEQTRIIEAILIDYFKTSKYNTHFAEKLSPKLKTLEEIYKTDFDAVAVEVDNENIGYLNMFSESVKSSYHHIALLDIRKDEGRVSVFDVSTLKSSTTKK